MLTLYPGRQVVASARRDRLAKHLGASQLVQESDRITHPSWNNVIRNIPRYVFPK